MSSVLHIHRCLCGNVWTCRQEEGCSEYLCRECEDRQVAEYWEARFSQEQAAKRQPDERRDETRWEC